MTLDRGHDEIALGFGSFPDNSVLKTGLGWVILA